MKISVVNIFENTKYYYNVTFQKGKQWARKACYIKRAAELLFLSLGKKKSGSLTCPLLFCGRDWLKIPSFLLNKESCCSWLMPGDTHIGGRTCLGYSNQSVYLHCKPSNTKTFRDRQVIIFPQTQLSICLDSTALKESC